MDMNYFDSINRQRSESPLGFNHKLEDWSVAEWFLAVMGELGEAANIAKKILRIEKGITRGNVKGEQLATLKLQLECELADVQTYLSLLAQRVGMNMAQTVIDVFNFKSDEIGCPIKLDPNGTINGA